MESIVRIKKRNKRKLITQIICIVAAIIPVIILLFPFIWIIPTAFKSNSEAINLPMTWLPLDGVGFDNFAKIFELDVNGATFLKSLFFTLFIAIVATVGGLFINILAAYALARYNFKGKKIIWAFLLVGMFVPGITIQLTSINVVSTLKLTDTILVLLLPGLAQSYTIFFLRQFFLGIPSSVGEAEEIDGAPSFSICWKVYVPQTITPIIIVGMGMFMGNWNSYIWPTLTIIKNTEDMTMIMQMMKSLSSYSSLGYGAVVAASLIVMVVPLTLYALLQKYIVEGASLTGIK